jgi:membrane fusion protein (multidrug efflux system)
MAKTFLTGLRRLAILPALLLPLCLTACDRSHAEEKDHGHHAHHEIVVTSPMHKDVLITQEYVCQIRSQNNIEVRPLQEGYLKEIYIKEGQMVQQDDPLFEIVPVLYRTRLDAEKAKARLMELKYQNTLRLFQQTPPIVSEQEVKLAQAELDEANARVKTAEAELGFTTVKAPFAGIVDRQLQQRGSLVDKKDVLTTLYDNRVMWVYFNVPEANYLEYSKGRHGAPSGNQQQLKLADAVIELNLADGSRFEFNAGDTVTIEGKSNPETGNIQFRADFPNPNGLLRHGMTGTVLIRRKLHHALVIPQRATFEFLDKRYAYVVGSDNVVRRKLITVQHEQDDIFVLKNGLDVSDKIILDGIKQTGDDKKLDKFEFRKPEEVLARLKDPAE